MGKLIEGYWDCPYCKTKGIKGSQRDCPNCGATRDKSVKFYMKDTNELSDEEASKISKEADWMCTFCRTYNSADSEKCKNCGASKSDAKGDYFSISKTENVEKQKENFMATGSTKTVEELNNDTNKSLMSNNQSSSSNTKSNLLKIFLPLLIVISIFAFMFMPKAKNLEIQDMFWEREIQIEIEKTVNENDWYLPEGGRLIKSQTEFKEYKQVLDHYETKTRQVPYTVTNYTTETDYVDLGNGYFETVTRQVPVSTTEYRTETYEDPVYRNEPVYATKYYYEIERWVYNRSVTTNGHDKEPYFGEYSLEKKERKGQEIETYNIIATMKGKNEKTYSMNFDEWSSVNVGDKIKAKISHGSSIELVK